MDAKTFFEKVARMREAQKQYFKCRTSGYLSESKRLEREIDEEIKRVREIEQAKNSPKLF